MNMLTFLLFLTMTTMMIMISLVQADLSVATSSEKVNISFNVVCGGAGDCVIGGDFDTEAEFPVETRVARMLYDLSQSTTLKTGNKNQASVNCPQSQGYRSCLPSSNGGSTRQQCNDFNRGC